MKKVLCIVLAILLLCLSGCSGSAYRSMADSEQPVYTIYPIYMYRQNGMYAVVVSGNRTVEKAVTYSENREADQIYRLELAEVENIQEYLGLRLEEVEALLGEYHVDMGSGFFIPSYLTVDGYLVSFTVSDHVVTRVGKTDLLTGEAVEWYA